MNNWLWKYKLDLNIFRFAHILLILNENTDFLCMLYKQTERFENILRGLLPECLYVTTKILGKTFERLWDT